MTSIQIIKPQLKVWVNSGSNDLEYNLLYECGIGRASSALTADIILFVGGADVDPSLYGEEALYGTRYDKATDKRDLSGWRDAKDKFKIGICRGGQFLNVMNGGKLWQDVDHHTASHVIVDRFTKEYVYVSSTHHQQFRPNSRDAVVIATARESTKKQSEAQTWRLQEENDTPIHTYFKQDFEVLFYPKTRSLCFQPHPEYSDPCTTAEYFNKVLWKATNNEYRTEKKESA